MVHFAIHKVVAYLRVKCGVHLAHGAGELNEPAAFGNAIDSKSGRGEPAGDGIQVRVGGPKSGAHLLRSKPMVIAR